jgi:BlaI family penicillinase repressor
MPDRQQLTELQIAILRLLWEQGELTVAQIWEQLYAERKLAQTTIATIVARLQRRRILARRTKDRQFVYRALVTEADVQHSMVSELTERLFAGDVAALVSHLVSARDMTPGDVARLKKMIKDIRPRTGESA